MSEGLSVIGRDIVSVGRRFAVAVAGRLAAQDKAVDNARRASTEVSRRRVERDEVWIYLDRLHRDPADEASTEQWSDASVQAAD